MVIKNKFNQKGQTLLIVVLVMVVSLTVGLSIISKSITSVRTTTEDANSAQALAAAEAGVAQAIQTRQNIGSPGNRITYSSNNASFYATVDEGLGEMTKILNGGSPVTKDEGIDLWLVDHDPNTGVPLFGSSWGGTSFTIYWGDTDPMITCDNQAALEVFLIKGPYATPTSYKAVLDGCNLRNGGTGNHFTNPPSGNYSIGGSNFKYSYTFDSSTINPNGGLIARIVPIYKDARIAVQSSATAFPSQELKISSTGKSTDTTIQHKINVNLPFSSLPVDYFTYGLVVHE